MKYQLQLSEDEIKELAEVGVTQVELLGILQHQWLTDYYLSGLKDGKKVYGTWIDTDGAADINWQDKPDLEYYEGGD